MQQLELHIQLQNCKIDIGEICGMDENLVYDSKQYIKMLSKTVAT